MIPCHSQVSKHLCTSPCNCGGMMQCGKYTGVSIVVSMVCLIQSQNLISSSCNEKTSGWSIDEIYEPALLNACQILLPPPTLI